MLTAVEVYDVVGKLKLTLPVVVPDPNNRFIIQKVDGLDPVPADMVFVRNAGQDGQIRQSTRTGGRNIVTFIQYNPDYLSNQTVQTLRRELYTYFLPGSTVWLRFINDDHQPVEVRGYVESHEAVIFSQEPEVQISVMTEDAYLSTLFPVTLSGYNKIPVNPSYYGTGKSGFAVELFVNRTINYVKFHNGLVPDIEYGRELIAGDILSISTIRGQKHMDVIRAGNRTSDLDALKAGTLDMVIESGVTSFMVDVAGASDIPWRMSFYPKFVGI